MLGLDCIFVCLFLSLSLSLYGSLHFSLSPPPTSWWGHHSIGAWDQKASGHIYHGIPGYLLNVVIRSGSQCIPHPRIMNMVTTKKPQQPNNLTGGLTAANCTTCYISKRIPILWTVISTRLGFDAFTTQHLLQTLCPPSYSRLKHAQWDGQPQADPSSLIAPPSPDLRSWSCSDIQHLC